MWYSSGNPFGLLGRRYVGHSLGWIVSLTIVIDLFSVCIAFTLAASRVLMTLGRDGLLPRGLARTSNHFHTPTAGLAVIAIWTLLLIAWTATSRYGNAVHTPNVLEAVLILSGTGSYLITLVYLMLAAGGVWLLQAERGRGGVWWKFPVMLTAIAVPILSFDGSLNPFPGFPNDIGVYLAAGSVCIAIVWYCALRVWRAPFVGGAAARANVIAGAGTSTARSER